MMKYMINEYVTPARADGIEPLLVVEGGAETIEARWCEYCGWLP